MHRHTRPENRQRGQAGNHAGLMMGMCSGVFIVAALLPALGLPAVLAIAILLGGAMFLVHARFMGQGG